MKFGLMLPNRGKPYGDVNLLVELALSAEESGWDGCFIWDHIGGGRNSPTVDPWICLAAIAARTQKIRFGTMITPLSRRRPWKVAREIVTLDYLSHGRVTLGVGLGDMANKDFDSFSEVTKPRIRAEMLDEALEIIRGLQSGKPYAFSGEHYQVRDALFQPVPIQQPHVPVWVGGHWPFKRPMQRAAQWNGVIPLGWGTGPLTPQMIRSLVDYILPLRNSDQPFDICKVGSTFSKHIKEEKPGVFESAGATWWIESVYSGTATLKQMQKLIQSGPPKD